MLVQPSNNAQQGSSSRSMSMSMDDSVNVQIQPIVQKMIVVNQHQLLVRKPSDQILRSPPTTSVTPQIASDRPMQCEIKDLLLINEEPSIKEQSMQVSEQRKVDVTSPKDEQPLDEQLIDEKAQLSYSDVRWSRLVSSKTSTTHQSFQWQLIQDNAALFEDSNTWFSTLPCLPNSLYYLSEFLHGLFICYFVTRILMDIGLNENESQYLELQIIMIVFQLIYTLNRIVFMRFYKGKRIDKMNELILHYFKNEAFLDIIGVIPILCIFSQYNNQYIQVIHLLSLRKLTNCIELLQVYQQLHKYIQYIQMLLEFHFATFISLTIILITQNQKDNYYTQFVVILYQPTEQHLIVYLVKLIMLAYYINAISRLMTPENEKNLINYFNVRKHTKAEVCEYFKQLKKQQNLQFLDQLPQTLSNDVKYQRYGELLSHIPIFKSSFSQPTMRKICNLVQEYTYVPNQTVLMQNTSSQHLFLILSGSVQISQIRNNNSQFNLKILTKGNTFNNQAFFKNTYSNICATSIGYSQIAHLDLEQFRDCIHSHYQERQKYKMMLDQIVLCEFYSLCLLKCYACGRFHDIDECDQVHYVPKRNMLVSYIQSNEIQTRKTFARSRRKHKLTKSIMLQIEENVLLFRQQNLESDPSDELHRHQDEIISIQQQQQYLREVTNPYTDRQNSLQQSQQTPHMVSQPSMGESRHSQPHQAMEIPNISPVQYVQQPPSGMSHSSYGQLLKDVSVNRKNNFNGSDKNSSGNLFSLPISSNGSKTNPNPVTPVTPPKQIQQQQQQQQEKEELISIQLKKAKLQDSVYYHQKRMQNQMDNNSQHTPSKYQKYHTTAAQQQQKVQRSDRKSNSCISESEKGEYQVNVQQEKQPSKYGITSSKFTGETAKQFMRNPLEMPNLEFYQSFEKSNQFSDYFPQYNVDQAIESYRQYQQSRSSIHK